MIVTAAIVGLVLGLVAGGRLDALLNARLRFGALIIVAILLRYGTQIAIANGVQTADTLRVPLYAAAFGVLGVCLWLNRDRPGLLAVLAGVLANGIAVVVNGGWMPVYLPSLEASGLTTADLQPTFHMVLPAELNLSFLLHAGPLGDIIPYPIPPLNNVTSIGDLLIAIGLGWFLFATLVWGEISEKPLGVAFWRGRPQPVTTDRPIVLGGGIGPGLVPPPSELGTIAPAERLPFTQRMRRHPYVRLARDARFSAFWTGQTISLFGDRLNQIAIGVLVLTATGSAFQTGLVFLSATLPNLILGPFAGPFVDRWDQKRVMIASDLIRALLVAAIPFVVNTNVALVYPIAFAITTVSLFFRPAKAAVVPRIVHEEDLVPANAALWTGETIADIAGYPLAGLLVAALGASVWIAFWIDSATYLVSAGLIAAIAIPPVVATVTEKVGGAVRSFLNELRDGWGVLRERPAMFQNTLISAVAQLSFGTLIALTIVYGKEALDGRFIPFPQNYAAIDAVIGIGNLIGGVALGVVGARMRKGPLIVLGIIAVGIGVVIMGFTSNVLVALVAVFGIGIFNLVYIVPTQAVFAEQTPEGFMGRVVAFRSSLVFGAMTLSMAVSSIAAEHLPVGTVFMVAGAITVVAGIVAGLLPAIRNS